MWKWWKCVLLAKHSVLLAVLQRNFLLYVKSEASPCICGMSGIEIPKQSISKHIWEANYNTNHKLWWFLWYCNTFAVSFWSLRLMLLFINACIEQTKYISDDSGNTYQFMHLRRSARNDNIINKGIVSYCETFINELNISMYPDIDKHSTCNILIAKRVCHPQFN